MLSKRDYLLMVALFATAFILFMSVNVGTDLLTRSPSAHPAYDKAVQTSLHENVSWSTPAVAIIAPEQDRDRIGWLTEWCLYQKYRYVLFSALPSAQELEGFPIVLVGDLSLRATDLPRLKNLTTENRDVIFTRLPSYDTLAQSTALQDFFGIRKCVQADFPLQSVHLLKNFLLSDERIYDTNAMYDESSQMHLSENYYLLRSGFQVFMQGVPGDPSISYYDYPSLLWETSTDQAHVFVVNTALFDSKAMLGVLCAMMAQTHPYYLYPVVDAQTISVLNFPLFTSENEDVLMHMYSRNSLSLAHDNIWPSVDKIFLTYRTVPSFFMTPRLDYSNTAAVPDDTTVSFYRRGIFKRMGTLGLSADQISSCSLAEKSAVDADFLDKNFSDLVWSTSYVPRDRLPEFLKLAASDSAYKDTSVILTDYTEDEPLLDLSDDGTLIASFTENGYVHTIQDDIRMIGLETALGLNNQQIDIKEVLYPETAEATWNDYSNRWSKAVTYQHDFTEFARISVTDMGRKTANFLSLQYTTEEISDGIRIHIQAIDDETSFILRLSGITINAADHATYEKISDSAYLLHCTGDTVDLHLQDTFRLGRVPTETQEVVP